MAGGRASPRATAALVLSILALVAGTGALTILWIDRNTDWGIPLFPRPTPEIGPATGSSPRPTPPTPTPTSPADDGPNAALTGRPSGLPEGWVVCTNDALDFTVAYPKDWHTAAREPDEECRLFDRAAFTVPPGVEFPAVDIEVVPDGGAYDDVVLRYTATPGRRVVGNEQAEVAGRRAIRVESVEEVDDGFFPRGTRIVAFVVDRGGRGFILQAVGLPEDAGHAENVRVLDRMAGTVGFG